MNISSASASPVDLCLLSSVALPVSAAGRAPPARHRAGRVNSGGLGS